jgi:hydroxyethylthiazole kinase
VALTPSPDAAALWDDLQAVRDRAPLVHNITNFVVMNFSANALLAVGASPVMAHAHDEVRDMVGIAQALVLNIGTLDPAWMTSMELALPAARARGIPVVLDPVGAGATPYRNAALTSLLRSGAPTVVRGNASEVMSVAGLAARTRGVDSAATSNEALDAARALARDLRAVICVSGADDHVVDPDGRHAVLSNGHPWMTRVTGVGCSASALVGAFAAVQPDAWRATLAAMACLGVVGELAAERTLAASAGVGHLQIELLDGLQLLSRDDFSRRLRLRHAHD